MARHAAPHSDYPGSEAQSPKDIPAKGWWQITKRAWQESKQDQVPLLAAGVAFYAFLALFPTMIAAVLLYGLVADPQTVAQQAEKISAALPKSAADLVTGQMDAITSTPSQSLGLGLLVALALALWSASGGVGNIVTALNIAYDEEETRGFIKRKLLALGLTVGAIIFVVVAVALVAVAPALLGTVIPSGAVYWLIQIGRWALLVLGVIVTLGLLYRWAPDRDNAQVKWLSVGAVVATVIWVIASIGFSIYVDNFSSYGETYGALAGVVVLLLWLWITNFIVLLGAEINAETEQQTVKDTTTGPTRPLGERNAVKADTVPGEIPEQARDRRRQGAGHRR